MRTMWQRIRPFVAHVPICGQLVYSSKSSFWAATKELSVATFFSLFPIWFYPVILKIGDGLPFWETLKSFMIRGELYLYSAALLGPWIYSTTKTYGGSDGEDSSNESDPEKPSFPKVWSIQFPHGASFSITSVLVCCSAAFLFGMLRTSTHDRSALELNEATLVTSAVLYGFTLFCMFCVLVYRLNLEETSDRFGEDTEELFAQWRNRN